MSDPVLPTVGAIVGLVVPALHITRILRDDVKRIKDAPRKSKTWVRTSTLMPTALSSFNLCSSQSGISWARKQPAKHRKLSAAVRTHALDSTHS
jgi:hypothetical protein